MQWTSKYLLLLAPFIFIFKAAESAPVQAPPLMSDAKAVAAIFANVSPADGRPGAVIAAPSRRAPNYYFHWVRDAALVMLALQDVSESAPASPMAKKIRQALLDYMNFSVDTQQTAERAGSLAETRFNVDGSISHDDWPRRQSDGPALRAVSFLRLAKTLIREGQLNFVKERLYRVEMPANSLIKKDLEFVAHHWKEPSHDVWEESVGIHFFNLMVQRRALVEGAELAQLIGDVQAAGFYRVVAKEIEAKIASCFDRSRGYFIATPVRVSGVSYKNSGLDSVVILGILHGNAGDGFLRASDEHVLSTVARMESVFSGLYPINQAHQSQSHLAAGVAIGRYPEDRYDGVKTDTRGNPWFLTTFAMSELYSRIALDILTARGVRVTELNREFFERVLGGRDLRGAIGRTFQAGSEEYKAILTNLVKKADAYAAVALSHADQTTGSMSEQFSRDNGFMQGANDLTWSYAGYLSASNARRRLRGMMR